VHGTISDVHKLQPIREVYDLLGVKYPYILSTISDVHKLQPIREVYDLLGVKYPYILFEERGNDDW